MKRNLFQFSIIALLLVFAGCRGNQQSKLIGVWENIPFTEPTEVKKYWQFYAGDLLEIYQVDESAAIPDTILKNKYQYEISASVFNVFPPDGEDNSTYGTAAGDPRGEYIVDELNDEYFKITKQKHPDGSTGAAYLRIEMVKR